MDARHSEFCESLSTASAELFACRQGVEREGLRYTTDGLLSRAPHQHSLGSKLTHPFVTTDFAEAQLELVTPPYSSSLELIHCLENLHSWVFEHLDQESIWPLSTPCILPTEAEIEWAQFGFSPTALYKETYRQGLSYRYGRRMQTLSGVHYNFSFQSELWPYLSTRFTDWSDAYFHIIRNVVRTSWLLSYLFGASPCVHATGLSAEHNALEPLGGGWFALGTGTSIRLDCDGYYGYSQEGIHVRYNSMSAYLADMKRLLTTPHPVYGAGSERGTQINGNILQIAAEHYGVIRPKPDPLSKLRPLESLEQQGIAYIELRCLDLDPFSPSGVSREQLDFLHLFCLYSLVTESSTLDQAEEAGARRNLYKVAHSGRQPGLELEQAGQSRDMKAWATDILSEMEVWALRMGAPFVRAWKEQLTKVEDPNCTPSAKVLHAIREEGDCLRAIMNLAERQRTSLAAPKDSAKLDQLAVRSWKEHYALDALSAGSKKCS